MIEGKKNMCRRGSQIMDRLNRDRTTRGADQAGGYRRRTMAHVCKIEIDQKPSPPPADRPIRNKRTGGGEKERGPEGGAERKAEQNRTNMPAPYAAIAGGRISRSLRFGARGHAPHPALVGWWGGVKLANGRRRETFDLTIEKPSRLFNFFLLFLDIGGPIGNILFDSGRNAGWPPLCPAEAPSLLDRCHTASACAYDHCLYTTLHKH